VKFALLVYNRPDRIEALSEEQRKRMFEEYRALYDAPGVVSLGRLKDAQSATTVRIQDGKTLITDGPFADTKEIFAGWFLLDADDIDGALAFAERIPATRLGGCVEVRPFVER
jgi:hypothetical protein